MVLGTERSDHGRWGEKRPSPIPNVCHAAAGAACGIISGFAYDNRWSTCCLAETGDVLYVGLRYRHTVEVLGSGVSG